MVRGQRGAWGEERKKGDETRLGWVGMSVLQTELEDVNFEI